ERRRRYRAVVAKFVEAGRGLAAAHAVGLVHRDFKPENVLVSSDGRILVTDFGLAHSMTDGPIVEKPPLDTAAAVARAGFSRPRSVGPPAYMAPEQLRSGISDYRSDEFSFCVALYEALYRQHPFSGETLQDLRDGICNGRLRSAPKRSGVPGWLRK